MNDITNKYRAALLNVIADLPLPGDEIDKISNGTIKYKSGTSIKVSGKNSNIKEGQKVVIINYDIDEKKDVIEIMINHLRNNGDTIIVQKHSIPKLIKKSRTLKLAELCSKYPVSD